MANFNLTIGNVVCTPSLCVIEVVVDLIFSEFLKIRQITKLSRQSF